MHKQPRGATVIVPSPPGCVTYGETIDHAIQMVRETIELYLERLREHGEKIAT